jgi:hypothetical protein
MPNTYPIIIFAHFDTTNIKDAEASFLNLDTGAHVILPETKNLTFTLQESTLDSSSKLVITSNGIDGIGYNDESFNIDTNKFNNTKIHFTVRVKDVNNNPLKSLPLIALSALELSIETPTNILSSNFYSNFGELTSQSQGGYFKGYFTTPLTGRDVRIKAIYNDTVSLTGYSSTFNIYTDSGLYHIRKVNENNDQTAQYKSLTFQQVMQDKLNFFNDFLGQIVGNIDSDPNVLGIKIFEKISNFVSNNSDVVYSNQLNFLSMLTSINDTYVDFGIQFPPSLQRLVDIFSVPLSRQLPGKNQFNTNFDDKGYISSQIYGRNKGSQINFFTGILSRNEDPTFYRPVIAYERFSKVYTLVSPLIPDAKNIVYIDNITKSYALSTYSSDWGWGLLLPNNIQNQDIPKYYDFYQYVDVVDNTLLQKFIDTDNDNNTYLTSYTTFNDYSKHGGIIDNILIHHMYTNTGIISST